MERITSAFRADGWENAILGIGGTKDPSAYTTFTSRPKLSDDTLEALYVEDHFASKVVEAMPRDALRPGWDLAVPGDAEEAARLRRAYATREEELDAAAEFAQGWCWGRVFGGALTYIVADDERDPALPLDETNISRVRALHTFDRRDVTIHRYYAEIEHPKFRRPSHYLVRPLVPVGQGGGGGLNFAGGVVIHESRCIVWGGQETTDRRRQLLQGWDDSVLERCWEPLRQLNEDYAAKSLLLGRISQAVYKIKGLYAMLAGKQEDMLRRRMGLMELSRSRARAIVLDTEEAYEQHQQSLGGVPETLVGSVLRLASAGDMPVTKLMGQSAAGMDATGEGDEKLWAATCSSGRTLELRPRHERLARLILLERDGPTRGREPDAWSIEYRPLLEPARKEIAEIGKIEAETDAMNIERGVYSAEHAALRYGPNGTVRVTLDADEIKARVERRKKLDGQPPKDNAELGTVAPRSSEARETIGMVARGEISRESGLAVLTRIHRFTDEDAQALLGPDTFVPRGAPAKAPGPPPEPQVGQGAGAPQPPSDGA